MRMKSKSKSVSLAFLASKLKLKSADDNPLVKLMSVSALRGEKSVLE